MAWSQSTQVDADDVAAFLGACPPLDALTPAQLDRAAHKAVIERYGPGEEILDAFDSAAGQPCVIWQGRVDVWGHPDRVRERPDETLVAGGLFGYVAALTGEAVGPRAVAASDAVIIRVAADLVAPAFASGAGARFLAREVTSTNRRIVEPPTYTLIDDLIISPPVIVQPSTTIADAAARMVEADLGYVAIALPNGRYGLVTDVTVRRAVAASIPTSSPVAAVMTTDPATVTLGASAAEALIKILDDDLDVVLVSDRSGILRGVVAPRDFVVSSSSTAGASLNEQIRRATTPEELRRHFQQVPRMLPELLGRGLSPSRVITVYSAIVDTVIRSAITMVFDRYPQLGTDAFTWLSLGSNGRREAVPSSDIDAAAAFDNDQPAERLARYWPALDEVAEVLVRVGLSHDTHGATPTNREFVRTHADWQRAARSWLDDPTQDRAIIMTCLLLDGRPIIGEPGLPEVAKVFADLRRHPETMRLLLREALTTPRTVHRPSVLVPGRRHFLYKAHALTPITNIARWVALSVGSAALPTRDRLHAGAGSQLLSESDATVLDDIFETVQGLRLRRQLEQVAAGLPPSDSVHLSELTAIERPVVLEAVDQVSAIQRRMRNLATLVLPELGSKIAGRPPGGRTP